MNFKLIRLAKIVLVTLRYGLDEIAFSGLGVGKLGRMLGVLLFGVT